MVLTITPADWQRMQSIALDSDAEAALHLIKEFVKRLKEQQNRGLKSHLG